jgi:hypothetical protein
MDVVTDGCNGTSFMINQATVPSGIQIVLMGIVNDYCTLRQRRQGTHCFSL